MIFRKKYYLNTTAGVDCIPITHEVHYAIRDSTCPSGMATVLVPEAGAGVVLIEPLPDVLKALQSLWEEWRRQAVREATTRDAKQQQVAVWPRVLGSLIGSSVHLPFHEGRLLTNPYTDVIVIDGDPVPRR
ncbi:MAG: YjbQ family protein, partial [Deltaproteobacteria bacterium]|nr:YjbQ family protein [Deltaproteobacteria bacterium]